MDPIDQLLIIIFFIILIALILFLFIKKSKLNQAYYETNQICPYLSNIHTIRQNVIDEVNKIKHPWDNWTEKQLFANNGTWKIYPFFAFDIWVKRNCDECPILYNFIKQIPGLKLATLSKLSSKMRLTPHYGWANHSNFVLRNHYGIDVPNDCYLLVNSIKKYHENNTWITFDDSLLHSAVNDSDKDRTILIIDVERPDFVENGKSTVDDTKELVEIVNYFKKLNIDTTNIRL